MIFTSTPFFDGHTNVVAGLRVETCHHFFFGAAVQIQPEHIAGLDALKILGSGLELEAQALHDLFVFLVVALGVGVQLQHISLVLFGQLLGTVDQIGESFFIVQIAHWPTGLYMRVQG